MGIGVWILIIFFIQGDNSGSQVMVPMNPEQNSEQFCTMAGEKFVAEFPTQTPDVAAKAIYSCFLLDPDVLEKARPPKI